MEMYIAVIIPVIAAMIAQVCKFVFFSIKHGTNLKFLLEYGHMPSSHAAMMTALLVTLVYFFPTDTAAFTVALTLTVIVLMDALRLRMYIGSYGKTLNTIITSLGAGDKSVVSKLKERVGHEPSEVLGGMIVGIAVALISAQIIEIL